MSGFANKRPQFLFDVAEELTWLRDHAGAEVAERWYQSLVHTLGFIQQNPFVGRARKDLSPPGIRSWRIAEFPRWLIFYSATEDEKIIFYRVRSGTMNLLAVKMES
jgi:plasmid stabilization system protein ParE